MRQRLLQSTLLAVGVAVALLGLPLLLAFEQLAEQEQLAELEEQSDALLTAIEQVSDPGLPLDQRFAVLREYRTPERRLTVFRRVGPTEYARVWPPGDGGDHLRFDDDLEQAARGDVGRVYRDGTFAVSVPVAIGEEEFLLRVLRDDEELHGQIVRARLSLLVLALVSFGAAGMAALWQGKRFAVPLEHLAVSARRLGEGDFSARAPRSGLPEPDEVAAALDSTADRLAVMLERSRSFSADASHQLRTPLTALRLDLEALEAAGADPALVAAAVGEADRLEATIAELLALAEAPHGEESLDVTELVAQRLDAWRSLARAQGREVVLDAAPVPPVRARGAALGQSLQVLLDNALEYGAGTITVSVAHVAGGVRVCVGDEGPGIPEDREATLFRPTGLLRAPTAGGWGRRTVTAARPVAVNGHAGRGLPLARSLVEAEGGRLILERARPGAVLCLLLPAHLPEPPPAAPA